MKEYYFICRPGEMPELKKGELPKMFILREMLGGTVERLHADGARGIVHLVNPDAKYKKENKESTAAVRVCSKVVLIYGTYIICAEDEEEHLRSLDTFKMKVVTDAMKIKVINDLFPKCCLCGDPIFGIGNNAQPLSDGVCCDKCNETRVVPERIKTKYGSSLLEQAQRKMTDIQKDAERKLAKPREKTVKQQLDQIAADICDHICKYRNTAKSEEELGKFCDDCPLTLLS